MNLFEQWRQLFEIAGLCLEDERYCILLATPWAYTTELSIVLAFGLVAGFAFLSGKLSRNSITLREARNIALLAHYQYEDERRRNLDEWANYLRKLIELEEENEND